VIAILLYEGVSGFEALSALAVARAADLPAELVASEALVPTLEGARLVPARLGVGALADADAAVLPGGNASAAWGDAELARALRARRGRWTLAAGDAVRLLAATGLAEGRRVALAPGEAAVPGTAPQHARLVADGRVLTSFGGDALADLLLHYVAAAHGDATARRAAERLGREARIFALGAAGE
jgi:transcriptional regulator GlxA family with amidase domain